MIRAIHSGAQTGSDLGALKAAKELGIKTGGWMPGGWMTEDGPKPEYGELYGMVEHPAQGYHMRTECNVRDSDATVIISENWKSAGTVLTIKSAKKYLKPFCLIDPNNNQAALEILEFIKNFDKNIILNVAGNRESVAPGIGDITYNIIKNVLKNYDSSSR